MKKHSATLTQGFIKTSVLLWGIGGLFALSGMFYLGITKFSDSISKNETIKVEPSAQLEAAAPSPIITAPFDKFDYFYVTMKAASGIEQNSYSFFKNNTELASSTGPYNQKMMLNSKKSGFVIVKDAGENGAAVSCGSGHLENRTPYSVGDNATCIIHNSNEYRATDWPDYVDDQRVIYQQCEKVKFYDTSGLRGENRCQKFILKVNEQEIDSTSEYYDLDTMTVKKELYSAERFSSIRIDDGKLTYIKFNTQRLANDFIVHDLSSGTKRVTNQVGGKEIYDARLVEGVPAYLLSNKDFTKDFSYKGDVVENVDGFGIISGNKYFLKPDPKENGYSVKGITLIKNDVGIKHYDGDYSMPFDNVVDVYPNCGYKVKDTRLCLYDDGNYYISMAAYPKYDDLVYVNGEALPNDVLPSTLENLFVFSLDGSTYVVYTNFDKIVAKNLKTKEEKILFNFSGKRVEQLGVGVVVK